MAIGCTVPGTVFFSLALIDSLEEMGTRQHRVNETINGINIDYQNLRQQTKGIAKIRLTE